MALFNLGFVTDEIRLQVHAADLPVMAHACSYLMQ
jgi:hypothetical protein